MKIASLRAVNFVGMIGASMFILFFLANAFLASTLNYKYNDVVILFFLALSVFVGIYLVRKIRLEIVKLRLRNS